MPLVFGGIVPHSPTVLPTGERNHSDGFARTHTALKELVFQLYAAAPDVVMVLTPHGKGVDSFAVQFSPSFTGVLKEFGDLTTKVQFPGVHELTTQVVERAKRDGVAVHLISTHALDHGVTVPLLLLASELKHASLLPVHVSPDQSPRDARVFGESIAHTLHLTNQRVVVIASAELSHALRKDAPAGFHPEAATFDQSVRQGLEKSPETLFHLDTQLVRSVGQCGYIPLLVLLGILTQKQFRTRVLAYEAPFGVGHLTAAMELA